MGFQRRHQQGKKAEELKAAICGSGQIRPQADCGRRAELQEIERLSWGIISAAAAVGEILLQKNFTPIRKYFDGGKTSSAFLPTYRSRC
jgi:hypothetical protein